MRESRPFRNGWMLLAMVAAALLALPGIAAAAPGDLDGSFSRDGQQFVNFGGSQDYGYTVALRPEPSTPLSRGTRPVAGSTPHSVVTAR
jgi:hypothetical protein